jgi:flavin-dependent dehydrogenase
MKQDFDAVIAGAGPAGLMAAASAAEAGLQVALIERRSHVAPIRRACCEQFILDENFQGETLRLEDSRIVFTQNGFTVDYHGPTRAVPDKYFFSPSGHRVHFAHPDRRAIVVLFDKGMLLQGLFERCLQLGVQLFSATSVRGAQEAPDGVTLSIVRGGRQERIKARKLVAADGVNAHVAEMLGLNRGRQRIARGLVLLSVLDSIAGYEEPSLRSYFGAGYKSFAPVIMGPSLAGDHARYVVVMGTPDKKPIQLFDEIRTNSPLAEIFAGARILNRKACVATVYSPLHTPCCGNTMVIGDAAAYVEVETQGALCCGFQAGRALARELDGRDGFAEYVRWWQDSFEFNREDCMQVARGFALVPTYQDDELDYLFALIADETLEGTYNQYKTPRLLWGAILQHTGHIQKERPELFEKIQGNNTLSLEHVFQPRHT